MPFDDPPLPLTILGGGGGSLPPIGDEEAPAAPTGLAAVAGDTQVSLGWSDNGEIDFNHYRVYRATVSGGPYTLTASLGASEYLATGLSNGTTYYFVVTAVDTFGYESFESSEVSATPAAPAGGDVTPPAVPTGLATTPGDRQVVLNWNDVADADFASFKVYRSLTSGGVYTHIATRTVSDYVDIGLTNSTTYFYKVSAVDTSGNESALSAVVSATPVGGAADTTPPPTPTGLTAAASDRAVALNWDDSPAGDFSHFRIYRSPTSGGTYTFIATRNLSNHTDGTLTNGTTYWYKVSSVDTSNNESALTSSVNATPVATPVPPGGSGDGHAVYADRQVTINIGDHIQTKIDANPSGTIYGFAPGAAGHLSAGAAGLFLPKGGDTFVGEIDGSGNPTSFLKGDWDQTQFGGGVSSPFSGPVDGTGLPSGVEIARVDFSLYAPDRAQSACNMGTGWTYWKCFAHHCKSGGFRLGVDGLIFGGKSYHNGQVGLFAHHPANGILNAVLDGMEIFENNYAGWEDWAGASGEAGGTKFIGPQGLLTNTTTRRCFAHHNNGPGFWSDQNGGGHVMEDCLAEDNDGPGFKVEICSGWHILQRNIARRNGGGANYFINNSRGTPTNPIIVQDNLSEFGTSHAEIWTEDVTTRVVRLGYVVVRRNTMRRAIVAGTNNIITGAWTNTSPPGMIWNENRYFTNVTNAWQWNGNRYTFAEWRAQGFDSLGSWSPLAA